MTHFRLLRGFCVSRKDRTGGGRWSHPLCHMATARLGSKEVMVGTSFLPWLHEWALKALYSHLVGGSFLESR